MAQISADHKTQRILLPSTVMSSAPSPDDKTIPGIRRGMRRLRPWYVFVLIAVIGIVLAIFTRDRSQFDMNNYSAALPGGGHGEMFVFRSANLRRPIDIVLYIDGKEAETVATFGTEAE